MRKHPVSIGLSAALISLSLTSCSLKDPPTQTQMKEHTLTKHAKIPAKYVEAAHGATKEISNGWVRSFHDKKLDRLVDEAIQNNLNLKEAVAKVDAAAAMAVQAGSELKPFIGAGGNAVKLKGDKGNSLTRSVAALSISWELDLWGRVRAQANAGEAAFEASEYQLEWLYQSIAAQTAKIWFVLSEARQQVNMLKKALVLYEKTLKVVESQYSQGRVTSGDVALAKSNVAQGHADLLQAEGARKKASRALEMLIGRYPAGRIDGLNRFTISLPPVPTGLPSDLLERRPDLVAAERAIVARFYAVETAKAARLPKISLTGSLNTSRNELNNLLSAGNSFWSVGSNFMAPIFTGGYLKAQVDVESAEYRAAFARYGQLALKAFSEVEQGLYNENILRLQEQYLREVVRESRKSLEVATKQFKIGKVTLLSVLQRQAIVIGAESNLIAVQSQRLQQRAELYMALGGDFRSKKRKPIPAQTTLQEKK